MPQPTRRVTGASRRAGDEAVQCEVAAQPFDIILIVSSLSVGRKQA